MEYGSPGYRNLTFGSDMLFPAEYMELITNGTYAFRFEVRSLTSDEAYHTSWNYNLKQLFAYRNPVL